MNDDVQAKIERLLKKAAPILKEAEGRKIVPSERGRQELHKVLDRLFPPASELTVPEMKALILSLLKEHSMGGFELCSRLRKANIRLKEAGAEDGAIYGIIHQLERMGFVGSEKREFNGRVLNVYFLTSDGRVEADREATETSPVAQWASSALAVQM